MNTKYNLFIVVLMAVTLVLGVPACGDDSTSGDDTTEDNCNALTLPSELTPVNIAVDYFTENEFPQEEQYMTYQQVKSIALTGSSTLSFGGNAALITTFLTVAPGLGIEPEAQGGNCVWNVNLAEDFPQFGQDLDVTVIASQANDRVNWEVRLSGELEEGEEVEDFLFLDGFTSNDESTGEWNGYSPENPNSPAYTYTWDIESENEYEINLDAFEQGATVATVNYVRDGADSNRMMFSSEGQTSAEIFWNENNDSGWIEAEGEERRCYSDFVNSACS